MTLKHIFGKPIQIEKVGDLYPVKVFDYETFEMNASILGLGKKHCIIDDEENTNLLDLIVGASKNEPSMIMQLENLFTLVCRKTFKFKKKNNFYAFISLNDDSYIGNDNYDIVRDTIMKQNLVFEPKVYESTLVQEWANKVKKARAKKGEKITVEDMISTVSTYKGLKHEEILDMTIYQLYSDFQRIQKLKDFDMIILFRSQGADIEPGHYAGYINMFRNPDDDIFVDKTKLKNINKAIQE